MTSKLNKVHLYLIVELIGIFVVIPGIMYFLVPFPIIPLLWVLALLCLRLLLKERTFDRKSLWRVEALKRNGREMLMQFVVVASILLVLVYFFMPEKLFALMLEKPFFWILIMILYPLLSVYPQELVYRTFFFHRYGVLFRHQWQLIMLSVLLFGYMHIIFHNWIAVFLTLGGGLLFASMYARTRSTFFVAIAHALYGDFLFTVGLGEYFYNGTVGMIAETFKF